MWGAMGEGYITLTLLQITFTPRGSPFFDLRVRDRWPADVTAYEHCCTGANLGMVLSFVSDDLDTAWICFAGA